MNEKTKAIKVYIANKCVDCFYLKLSDDTQICTYGHFANTILPLSGSNSEYHSSHLEASKVIDYARIFECATNNQYTTDLDWDAPE